MSARFWYQEKSTYSDGYPNAFHRVSTVGEVDLCFRYDSHDDRWQWKPDRKHSAWCPVENLDGSPDDELRS